MKLLVALLGLMVAAVALAPYSSAMEALTVRFPFVGVLALVVLGMAEWEESHA